MLGGGAQLATTRREIDHKGAIDSRRVETDRHLHSAALRKDREKLVSRRHHEAPVAHRRPLHPTKLH